MSLISTLLDLQDLWSEFMLESADSSTSSLVEPPTSDALSLTDLPDPCLLAVLQCLAADSQRSLFSAARAHSRLHQAAVTALHNVDASVKTAQQMDGVLLYLDRHAEHIDSIGVTLELSASYESRVSLRQLPPKLHLTSLQLNRVDVQLQPERGFPGVLQSLASLKQLRLDSCRLLDTDSPPLQQLPAGLEHLQTIRLLDSSPGQAQDVRFSARALHQLQSLTFLQLDAVPLEGIGADGHTVQPLQPLTRLLDLRLGTRPAWTDAFPRNGRVFPVGLVSGAHQLTRLEVSCGWCWDAAQGGAQQPAVERWWQLDRSNLAGKTQLQHLTLHSYYRGAQLLSDLGHLQQLTHLELDDSFGPEEANCLPAAAFSALTASSKLQQLTISSCTLPGDVWQHVFPAGRQLPHLQKLHLSGISHPSGYAASVPAASLLVGCCPGLQVLRMYGLQHSAEQLATLQGPQGLSRLHTLQVIEGANYGRATPLMKGPVTCIMVSR